MSFYKQAIKDLLVQCSNRVRILYNPYNIDSCYAATLCAERLLLNDKTTHISTTPIDYKNYDAPIGECNLVIFCGVSLSARLVMKELQYSKPSLAVRFEYDQTDTSGQDSNVIGYHGGMIVNINPNSYLESLTPVDDQEETEMDHHRSDNSIAMLVNDFFQTYFGHVELTENQARLLGAISDYINLRAFPSIFEKQPDEDRYRKDFITSGRIVIKDKDDLAFLYRNMNSIQEAAEKGTAHLVLHDGADIVGDYSRNLASVRKLIQRNMNEKAYVGKVKYFKAQTVAVAEENAVEVMRHMSMALPTVITYEDVYDERVWRIFTTNPGVINTLREAVRPTREWRECRIVYMAAPQPAPSERVS